MAARVLRSSLSISAPSLFSNPTRICLDLFFTHYHFPIYNFTIFDLVRLVIFWRGHFHSVYFQAVSHFLVNLLNYIMKGKLNSHVQLSFNKNLRANIFIWMNETRVEIFYTLEKTVPKVYRKYIFSIYIFSIYVEGIKRNIRPGYIENK